MRDAGRHRLGAFVTAMMTAGLWTGLSTGPLTGLAAQAFHPPVRLECDGKPITTTGNAHAAPYLYDVDGDGTRDLLVGQYTGGFLRIYRNAGTDAAPRYQLHGWFEAGGKIAKVPTG